MEYNIHVSGNAPWLFPTDSFFGLLWYGDTEALEMPKRIPYKGEWGEILTTVVSLRETYPMPYKVNLVWLSLIEKKFYEVDAELPKKEMEDKWNLTDDNGDLLFSHIVIGMAPYGQVAIWLSGYKKSIIIDWIQGEETTVELSDFLPYYSGQKIEDYCDSIIGKNQKTINQRYKTELPSHNLFDKYMQQFTYRYLSLFEHWDGGNNEWKKYEKEETTLELDYIEEVLFDGTHGKLHDGGLMNYHQAGKPKKLAVKWHIKKSEYMAYFWFEDEEIRAVFDRFYGAHPKTKTDFMIRIDSDKKKFELALYRYGLKEPQVISESAYQLLVFKNKFEYFRSENYNQPRGAWIW